MTTPNRLILLVLWIPAALPSVAAEVDYAVRWPADLAADALFTTRANHEVHRLLRFPPLDPESPARQQLRATITTTAHRWQVRAQALLDDDLPLRTHVAQVPDRQLLPVAAANALWEVWCPTAELRTIDDNQAILHVSAAANMTTDQRARKWPLGTFFTIHMPAPRSPSDPDVQLQHAFIRIGAPPDENGRCRADLIAIPSARRQIEAALVANDTITLIPAAPRPGPVRLRLIDRRTKHPLPNVEVYATRHTFSTNPQHLIGVTGPTREIISWPDERGALWFIVLRTGNAQYDVSLLNRGDDAVRTFPLTPGASTFVARELDYLEEDFLAEQAQFEAALRAADAAFKSQQYTAAREQYQQARDAAPVAERYIARAKAASRHYADIGNAAADDERIAAFSDQLRERCETNQNVLRDRLDRLAQQEDIADRVARAADLERAALQHLHAFRIDTALERYEQAASLLPTDNTYRAELDNQRKRIAERWALRGGDPQRAARDFVFDQLAAATTENAATVATALGEHLNILVKHEDIYTLRAVAARLAALIDPLVVAARTAADGGKLERAESLAQTARELIGLRESALAAAERTAD